MQPQLTLGVIGHVDHGKTSLVKAISGIDTDRLKEEKERGMSIVLGFAHLEFSEGIIDLIDVPGHENFIRTMIAGATGIGAAALVVDAHEGIKPQTVEHLAITELIGIRRGLVVITKSDLVDDDAKAALLNRLRMLLKGTYLDYAPRIFTSARTGEGVDELKRALKNLLHASLPSTAGGRFWLPIDRAFSIAGRGTVVTGTMRLGRLAVGEEVALMPHGRSASVRQIEVHGRAVEQVQAGQRAGINLRHIKARDIARGDALASMGLLQTSLLLDAQATVLRTHERLLRNGQAVRLLFGTTDVVVHVRILSGENIQPGHAGVVQFRAMRPVATVAGEPFILRCESPPVTIGGGRFLDPVPMRHRRSNVAAMARLQVLAGGSGDAVLIERLKMAGVGGMPLAALAAQAGRSERDVMQAVAGNDAIITHDKTLMYRPCFDSVGDILHAALQTFHRQYPMRQGAPLSYCRTSLPQPVGESLFKAILHGLCDDKRIEVRRGLARIFGYDPLAALSMQDRNLAFAIEERFRSAGVMPPDLPDVLEGDANRERIFYMLVERDVLLTMPGEQPGRKLVFHCDVINEVGRHLGAAYPAPAQFTVSQARELLGSTRKFTVPLLQHFDAAGYTRRCGDKRMMIRPEQRRK